MKTAIQLLMLWLAGIIALPLLVLPSSAAANTTPPGHERVTQQQAPVLPKAEMRRNAGLKCHGGLVRTKKDEWKENLWAASVIGGNQKVYKFDAVVRVWYWECPNRRYTNVLKPRKMQYCVRPQKSPPVIYIGHFFNPKFYGSNLRDVVDPVRVFVQYATNADEARQAAVSLRKRKPAWACLTRRIAERKQRWLLDGEAHWRVRTSAYLETAVYMSEPWLTAGKDRIKFLIPRNDVTTKKLHRVRWNKLNP